MPKLSKAPRYCPAWFVQVAELMVQSGVSFFQAVVQLKIPVDQQEAENSAKRKEFQEILRAERNKYHQMVANDPTRTKSVVLGHMVILAEKLEKDGEFDKAAQVWEKLAKMEGWMGGDSNVNIFAGLTAADIAAARERIAGGIGKNTPGSRKTPTVVEGAGSC